MKRRIVAGLETICDPLHPITHSRVWLWLVRMPNAWCLPATWSYQLDQRWKTGHWT